MLMLMCPAYGVDPFFCWLMEENVDESQALVDVELYDVDV